MGRTEFLTPTIRSEPRLESANHHESEMALFNECTQSCARIVLDLADIVRDGGFYANSQPAPPTSTSPRKSDSLAHNVCMSEKRTKADKEQREADLLDKKSSHRPPQNQGKKPREDFNQAAVRIVEEAAEKH